MDRTFHKRRPPASSSSSSSDSSSSVCSDTYDKFFNQVEIDEDLLKRVTNSRIARLEAIYPGVFTALESSNKVDQAVAEILTERANPLRALRNTQAIVEYIDSGLKCPAPSRGTECLKISKMSSPEGRCKNEGTNTPPMATIPVAKGRSRVHIQTFEAIGNVADERFPGYVFYLCEGDPKMIAAAPAQHREIHLDYMYRLSPMLEKLLLAHIHDRLDEKVEWVKVPEPLDVGSDDDNKDSFYNILRKMDNATLRNTFNGKETLVFPDVPEKGTTARYSESSVKNWMTRYETQKKYSSFAREVDLKPDQIETLLTQTDDIKVWFTKVEAAQEDIYSILLRDLAKGDGAKNTPHVFLFCMAFVIPPKSRLVRVLLAHKLPRFCVLLNAVEDTVVKLKHLDKFTRLLKTEPLIWARDYTTSDDSSIPLGPILDWVYVEDEPSEERIDFEESKLREPVNRAPVNRAPVRWTQVFKKVFLRS